MRDTLKYQKKKSEVNESMCVQGPSEVKKKDMDIALFVD